MLPVVDDLHDLNRIWASQSGLCVYCKVAITRETAHLDHIWPLARGGTNWPDNLQFLCALCNRSKHAKPPEVFAATFKSIDEREIVTD